MNIVINGQDHKTDAPTVTALLDELDIKSGGVAVELNMSVIKKIDYEAATLSEGDQVEIVNFVGGG